MDTKLRLGNAVTQTNSATSGGGLGKQSCLFFLTVSLTLKSDYLEIGFIWRVKHLAHSSGVSNALLGLSLEKPKERLNFTPLVVPITASGLQG